MKDSNCIEFLQWALPQLGMRWLGFRKVRKQVCKRIDRRLKQLDLVDVGSYRSYLDAHPTEWLVLDGDCRISISRFYRDRAVFDYLRAEILPELATTARWSAQHQVRCWSAGCASGEEPYTLNIIWKLAVGPRCADVALNLVATDNDPHLLDRARRACYSKSSLKDFPRDWLRRVFAQSDELFWLKPEYRDGIDFVRQDIRREMPEGDFHAVFCRHLAFTYFDERVQRDVIEGILAKLPLGGILVTGKQEKLLAPRSELQEIRPNMGIYQKRNTD